MTEDEKRFLDLFNGIEAFDRCETWRAEREVE